MSILTPRPIANLHWHETLDTTHNPSIFPSLDGGALDIAFATYRSRKSAKSIDYRSNQAQTVTVPFFSDDSLLHLHSTHVRKYFLGSLRACSCRAARSIHPFSCSLCCVWRGEHENLCIRSSVSAFASLISPSPFASALVFSIPYPIPRILKAPSKSKDSKLGNGCLNTVTSKHMPYATSKKIRLTFLPLLQGRHPNPYVS